MTALRRPGARWRLLVHEWVGRQPGEETLYGDAYNVDGAGQPMPKQAARWRWKSTPIGHTNHSTHDIHLPQTEFDELVVGRWLHVEQQDAGRWWCNIGQVTLIVQVDRDGNPWKVTVFSPEAYAGDPAEGCTYDYVGIGTGDAG